jgi:hypothetical protein
LDSQRLHVEAARKELAELRGVDIESIPSVPQKTNELKGTALVTVETAFKNLLGEPDKYDPQAVIDRLTPLGNKEQRRYPVVGLVGGGKKIGLLQFGIPQQQQNDVNQIMSIIAAIAGPQRLAMGFLGSTSDADIRILQGAAGQLHPVFVPIGKDRNIFVGFTDSPEVIREQLFNMRAISTKVPKPDNMGTTRPSWVPGSEAGSGYLSNAATSNLTTPSSQSQQQVQAPTRSRRQRTIDDLFK